MKFFPFKNFRIQQSFKGNLSRGDSLQENKKRKQLIIGCILFGVIVLLASVQVLLTPFLFVRSLAILTVICCSAGIGAFIRELYILREK